MKHELETNDVVESKIGDDVIKSVISPVITDTTIYYIYLTHMNSIPMSDTNTSFMMEKPTRGHLIQYHTNIINKLY